MFLYKFECFFRILNFLNSYLKQNHFGNVFMKQNFCWHKLFWRHKFLRKIIWPKKFWAQHFQTQKIFGQIFYLTLFFISFFDEAILFADPNYSGHAFFLVPYINESQSVWVPISYWIQIFFLLDQNMIFNQCFSYPNIFQP